MTNYFLKILVECICVGVLVVIFGLLASFIISSLLDLKPDCKKWNNYHAITLFLTGVFIHLFCEFMEIPYKRIPYGNMYFQYKLINLFN